MKDQLPGGMGNAMSFGKSGAKVYVADAQTGVTFENVAGQDEAKESLMEIVDFCMNLRSMTRSAPRSLRGCCLSDRPVPENPIGQGSGRGGRRAVLLYLRQRICGDVCRHGGR